MSKMTVQGTEIAVITIRDEDYISLTDMIQAKEGDFFISSWLRNRNTVEFLGIWEEMYNPDFNSLEFEGIKIVSVHGLFRCHRHNRHCVGVQ